MDLQLYGYSTLEAGFLTGIKYYALVDRDMGKSTIASLLFGINITLTPELLPDSKFGHLAKG